MILTPFLVIDHERVYGRNVYKGHDSNEIAPRALEQICDFLITSTDNLDEQREYLNLKSRPLTAAKYSRVCKLVNDHALLVLLPREHWVFDQGPKEPRWAFREAELPLCDKDKIRRATEKGLVTIQQRDEEPVPYLLISESVLDAFDKMIAKESTSCTLI
jgi:hypothetical protein